MLALTILVLARAALTSRPRLSLRRERSLIAAWRMVAAGALVMLAMLSPVLYALGDHVLSGNADLSPPLWRSSPAGIDLAAFVAAQPEPLGLGRRRCGRCSTAGRATPTLPRSGRLPVARLPRGDRRRLVARRLAGLPHPRRRHDLLRPADARPVPPRGGRQHADPAALERAALRAGPRSGAIAGPLRGAGDDGGRGALRAGARARRPQPSRSAAPMAHGRRRPAGDRAGARAAHALLRRRFPRSTRPSPRDPRPDVRVLELPVGVRTAPARSACSTRAPSTSRRGTARRSSAAICRACRRSAGATRGARPVLNALMLLSEGRRLTPEQDRAARDRADEFLRRIAPRLRGDRRDARLAGARRLRRRSARAHPR